MSFKPTNREEVLGHLVRLAKHPGWKAWAWHAAKEYESIDPYALSGLQEELKQRMQQEKAAQK